ncbi:probable WRKY transcription factor 54-like isoform X1 [Cucumis sativus]|uniref:WRKY domain-containing protein n=1 Tax=Cucumis sativus TaxID=3659 RepID=A0A0A0KMB3_CUCSA|nr:probable WRKY transcription factor 54-like isoform X1 [Cucumis sativus]KGN50748.1 hypothetical protein Csa_005890 [Cucumis sativus]
MDAPEFSHGRISPAELRRKITAKLLPGQDSAAHLRILLQSATATEQDKRALATKILTSITEAISILESAGEELSCPDHSLCSDLDSGESRRSRAVKDNPSRANKRRRSMNSRSVRTSRTTEDNYGWRKYGQKAIHNTTYPRSYYRCTHKFDQGCQATKQVQRMEGDDSEIMYNITYISDHTCRRPASPIDASAITTLSDSSNLISFSSIDCNGPFTEGTGYSLISWRPSDDDVVKIGETATTSGSTDDHEIDLWSDLKDFLELPNNGYDNDNEESILFLNRR